MAPRKLEPEPLGQGVNEERGISAETGPQAGSKTRRRMPEVPPQRGARARSRAGGVGKLRARAPADQRNLASSPPKQGGQVDGRGTAADDCDAQDGKSREIVVVKTV